MNIMIYSDTHGDISRAIEMYNRMKDAATIDLLIHCGDHIGDARELEEILGIPTVAVPGNCDGSRKRDIQIVESPAGRILVTHGHMEDVKFSLHRLRYLALENDCRIVCFGHSHVPVNETVGGIYMVNPGSLTNPRGGSDPSCAFAVATDTAFSATILKY